MHAVDLAIAVSIFLQLGVAGPVPGVLYPPTVTHVAQQRIRTRAQTRDLVTSLINGFALARVPVPYRDHRGAARPVLHDPLRRGHAPECPGDVSAVPAFTLDCVAGAFLEWKRRVLIA